MPYSVHVEPALRRATIRLARRVEGAEVIAAAVEAFRSPAWASGFSTLWDASDIQALILTLEDVAAFGKVMAELAELRGPGRSAIVTHHPDVQAGGLLLALKSKSPHGREFRVVSDLAEAEAWLAEAPAGVTSTR